LPDAELAGLVIGLERIGRRVAAAQVAVLGHADAARLGTEAGASSTAAWLRGVADVPIGDAKARLALHTALRRRPQAGAAFSAGEIGTAAVTAVCAAMDALPAGVPAGLETDIETLLEVARDDGITAVIRRAAEISHRFAPDQLEATEQQQVTRRRLQLRSRHDGIWALHGLLDPEASALALAVLSPLAAPQPTTGGNPDPRTAAHRYGDAFVQLCQLASTARPDVRGERPHILITINYDTLLGQLSALGLPAGRLDTGQPISGAAARRIGCDAHIIPIVLGSHSEPLDISRPPPPPAIRRATIARDGGCIGPHCDRPPAWCDLHHIRHWADGGTHHPDQPRPTLRHHHRAIHHHGWTIHMINGLPWLIPPRWIDPHQTPQLNNRLRTQHLTTTLPTDLPTPMSAPLPTESTTGRTPEQPP
jgi:hypothetical protein